MVHALAHVAHLLGVLVAVTVLEVDIADGAVPFEADPGGFDYRLAPEKIMRIFGHGDPYLLAASPDVPLR